MHGLRSTLAHGVALIILVAALFVIVGRAEAPVIAVDVPVEETIERVASPTPPVQATSTSFSVATTAPATTTKIAKKASIQATKQVSESPTSPPSNELKRIENPYATPPLEFDTVNASARSALVNIYCAAPSYASIKPITGSGVMIDSRGIVLTNAHVAQYVLIAQSGRTDLTCTVRTGAPAVARWIPVVLYIPPHWVEKHAFEIVQTHVQGTGEHDYAFLYLNTDLNGAPLAEHVSALGYDTREAIGFTDDTVLTASYPVEFAGSTVISNNLHPVTSISTIKQLMTFGSGTADVISLGGLIQAQRGASGGVVVNQWNNVIGLVTTTSDGATTGERDLHAITTAHIERDLRQHHGTTLSQLLAQSPDLTALTFEQNDLPRLSKLLLDQILGN